MLYVLYNSKANNNTGETLAKEFSKNLQEEHKLISLASIDVVSFVTPLKSEDKIILLGGDGTLNRFVNDIGDIKLKPKLFFKSIGTGNDFINDINNGNNELLEITDYIYNLPVVEVNGMKRKFINGIGYGIDGYCCEVADKLKKKSNKPINYTAIAIKGLLFHFKRVKAKLTIDGKEYYHKHVWLAPTMNGRFYGGGMNIAPDQDRLKKPKTLTTVIFKGKSKIHTLMVFPSIFKGKLGNNKKMTAYYTGRDIKVEFDKPTALQIDGETVLGVTTYSVRVND